MKKNRLLWTIKYRKWWKMKTDQKIRKMTRKKIRRIKWTCLFRNSSKFFRLHSVNKLKHKSGSVFWLLSLLRGIFTQVCWTGDGFGPFLLQWTEFPQPQKQSYCEKLHHWVSVKSPSFKDGQNYKFSLLHWHYYWVSERRYQR